MTPNEPMTCNPLRVKSPITRERHEKAAELENSLVNMGRLLELYLPESPLKKHAIQHFEQTCIKAYAAIIYGPELPDVTVFIDYPSPF